jgi:hypothetical protein
MVRERALLFAKTDRWYHRDKPATLESTRWDNFTVTSRVEDILLSTSGLLLRARTETLGSLTDTTLLNRADVNDVGVDSAGNAILRLDIQLGDLVSLDGSVILDITLGGSVNQVADKEAGSSFVLERRNNLT